MRLFLSEHKETLQVIAGIVIAVAGFVIMILGYSLIGLIALGVGMVWFTLTLSRILRSGGYSGESACVSTMGGMGRQQSEAAQDRSAGAATETTSAIWDDMTGN